MAPLPLTGNGHGCEMDHQSTHFLCQGRLAAWGTSGLEDSLSLMGRLQGGMMSGWENIRMGRHQDGKTSGWEDVRMGGVGMGEGWEDYEMHGLVGLERLAGPLECYIQRLIPFPHTP